MAHGVSRSGQRRQSAPSGTSGIGTSSFTNTLRLIYSYSSTTIQDSGFLYVNETNLRLGIRQSTPTSTLHIAGSIAVAVETLTTTSTTLNVLDCVNLASDTATHTLPDATTCAGRIYYIKSTGSGKTVTIAPPAGQFIDGSSANRTITTQDKALVVVSDGAHWYILSEFDGTF